MTHNLKDIIHVSWYPDKKGLSNHINENCPTCIRILWDAIQSNQFSYCKLGFESSGFWHLNLCCDSVIPYLSCRLYISVRIQKTPCAPFKWKLYDVQKKHAIVVHFWKHCFKATDQHKRKPKQLQWFSFQSLCFSALFSEKLQKNKYKGVYCQ